MATFFKCKCGDSSRLGTHLMINDCILTETTTEQKPDTCPHCHYTTGGHAALCRNNTALEDCAAHKARASVQDADLGAHFAKVDRRKLVERLQTIRYRNGGIKFPHTHHIGTTSQTEWLSYDEVLDAAITALQHRADSPAVSAQMVDMQNQIMQMATTSPIVHAAMMMQQRDSLPNEVVMTVIAKTALDSLHATQLAFQDHMAKCRYVPPVATTKHPSDKKDTGKMLVPGSKDEKRDTRAERRAKHCAELAAEFPNCTYQCPDDRGRCLCRMRKLQASSNKEAGDEKNN